MTPRCGGRDSGRTAQTSQRTSHCWRIAGWGRHSWLAARRLYQGYARCSAKGARKNEKIAARVPGVAPPAGPTAAMSACSFSPRHNRESVHPYRNTRQSLVRLTSFRMSRLTLPRRIVLTPRTPRRNSQSNPARLHRAGAQAPANARIANGRGY